MKIIFEKIRFKNFLSYGNNWTEINFLKSPSTTILGRNGSGKSVIADSICFALYGKPYRKINKPQLVNTINDKNLLCEIYFRVGEKSYKVIRGIKPSIFEIYVNDSLVPQDSKSVDYQLYLERDILKMSFKSFCQIVIVGSASWTPFMQLPTGQRREIIEDLLDQQIFTKMNSLLSSKFTELKSQQYETEKNYEIVLEKVKLHQKAIVEAKTNLDEEIQELNHNIDYYEKNLVQIKKEILKENEFFKNLQDKQNIFHELCEEHERLHNERKKLEKEVNAIHKEITFYETTNICPKCNNELTEELKKKELKKLQEKNDKISQDLNLLIQEIQTLKQNDDYKDQNSQILEVKIKLRHLKENYQDYQKKIEIFNDKKINVLKKKQQKNKQSENDLKKLKDHFTQIKSEKEHLENQRDLYKKAQILLKDNGIKAKIISKTIPVINKLVNKYIEYMDMFISFELDETFNETIKSRFLESYSYNNFSEGEKSRINLALLFSWRDIAKMKNSASTNLLILDEVFDGPLDNEGAEIFANIIKGLTENNNVFIITHNENLFDKFHSTIKIYKKNYFSFME